MSDTTSGNGDAVREIARLARSTEVHGFSTGDGDARLNYLAHHQDLRLTDVTAALDARKPHPRRRTGTVKLLSVDAFIEFCLRMNEGRRSVVFADTKQRTVTAVLDYHDPLNATDNVPLAGEASPHWGQFRAHFSFPFSRQWKTWHTAHREKKTQGDLAGFIEDNIRDVRHETMGELPEKLQEVIRALKLHLGSPQRLLESARGFSVTADEVIRQVIDTSSGEAQIVYEETHNKSAPAEMKVPTAFTIGIPVFEGDAPYHLLCRLRYRKHSGAVVWIIDIQDIEGALEDAFNTAIERIRSETGLCLLAGEAP